MQNAIVHASVPKAIMTESHECAMKGKVIWWIILMPESLGLLTTLPVSAGGEVYHMRNHDFCLSAMPHDC